MPLWISLYLPFHSLDAVFPYWHTKQPVLAVLEHDQVCALTPKALQAGITPGMRLGTAQALAPQAQMLRRNRQAEHQGLQQALLCLLQFTPDITQLDAHSLALEVSASLQLFGGPRALFHKAQHALQGLGLNTRLSMAPTAHGAWALARQTQTAQRRVVKPATLTQKLNALPIHSLPALLPWLEWFEGLGCFTLGQLRRLPRKGLQQRTRPEVMLALDAAYGLHAPPHVWVSLPEQFNLRYEPLQRLEHLGAVQAVARQLIEQLCAWLQAGHRACNQLLFTLHHEKGRHARPPTPLQLALSQAGWRPADFLPALEERFNRLVLPEHVIALELQVATTLERQAGSLGLFPEPAQWAHQENRLLDLLRARLGEHNILHARPFASHLPEQANQWSEAGALPRPSKAADAPGVQQPEQARPFWLLNPPVALQVLHDSPVYQGRRLQLLQGPERIENGWWHENGHQQRDYFIAQDTHHARYWVFRQRGTLNAQWFLHGLFG